MSTALVVAGTQGHDQPKRRLENLAVTDPIPSPEHERKKREFRARLKREHEAATKIKTVTTQAEIAIGDAAYWAHPPELRLKYLKEAEEARAKWADIEKEQSKRGRPRKASKEPVTEVPSATGPLKVGPIIFEPEMMRRIERDNRKCPDCGKRSLEPGKQYCVGCRIRRRKAAKNQRQRKWRAQNGGRA